MEHDNEPPLRSLIFGFGGLVEPADRFERLLSRPAVFKGEHFELVDPSSGSRHRAGTPYQIERLAERTGSSRYTRIAADGARTVFDKVEGRWQEGASEPPRSSSSAMRESADAEAATKAQPPRPTDRETCLQAALTQRYHIGPPPPSLDEPLGQTEYRFRERPTLVAFVEWGGFLSTQTNLPQVARSMVDLAELRSWGPLRVSGDEAFTREIWHEAKLRGLKTLGHEPDARDFERLQRGRDARWARTAGRDRSAAAPTPPTPGANRRSVLAAIDALLTAQHVPAPRHAAVMAAAAKQLEQCASEGRLMPKVKVYDRNAPPQRSVAVTAHETPHTRGREQAGPAR